MKHFSLMLLGAVGAFFVLSPAQAADFRVIQWNITKACQIYDFGWGLRPIPPNYRVLTGGAAELRCRAQGERRLGARGPLFDLAGNEQGRQQAADIVSNQPKKTPPVPSTPGALLFPP
jgi:hypothetical protein